MGNLDLSALAADLRALELEHRGGVVDVGRVQQSPQRACQSRCKATNEVGQANSVCAAPGDELELDQPVELGHRLIALFPIAIHAQHLVFKVVDHQDVRGHLALGAGVALKLQPCVDVIDRAASVDVLGVILAAFNSVVGLFGLRLFRLHRRPHIAVVNVQPTPDAAVKLPLRDVLALGHALRGVEVRSREWQDDVVNGDELRARALLVLVVPHLHEL